jgi:hypothetical protein
MKLNLLFLTAATALVNAAIAEPEVQLGTSSNYVILAKTGIDTVPDSMIKGNVAVSPISATAMTGFGLEMHSSGEFSRDNTWQILGVAEAASYGGVTATALTTAVLDMEIAYTDAAGRPNNVPSRINPYDGEIGGKTLTPGVYTFTTDINISDTITPLFFSGNSTDVFVIQTTGSIVQAANTQVVLEGEVKAKNIFWQVAGDVSVGAGAHMQGNLIVKTAVTFVTGSSLYGRVLSQTACSLQMATIKSPSY